MDILMYTIRRPTGTIALICHDSIKIQARRIKVGGEAAMLHACRGLRLK